LRGRSWAAPVAFDELLLLQIWLARRRRERESEVAPALGPPGELVARYRDVLPFGTSTRSARSPTSTATSAQRADVTPFAG
jgi:RecG-like helicase